MTEQERCEQCGGSGVIGEATNGIKGLGDELDDECDVAFKELVEEMSDSRDDKSMTTEYFDTLLSGMYDWADANLIWIEPVAVIKLGGEK